MNGKDLFEGMSYVDERFIDEAENKRMPKQKVIPWLRAASVAACLCLILFGLRYIAPDPDDGIMDGQNIVDSMGPGGEENRLPDGAQDSVIATPGDQPSQEVPSVILYVEKMTAIGFTGTVAQLVDTEIFEIGMELNVVVADGTRHEAADGRPATSADSATDYAGRYVMVQFTEYNPDTGTIVVDIIQEVPKEG